MSIKLNIAIVGATGLVGKALIEILAQRDFPVGNLFLLASDKSAGQTVIFKQKEYSVELLSCFDWKKNHVDIAFFSAGNEVSLQYAPIARDSGCTVIDNSSAFRYQENIPLIVPEINGFLLGGRGEKFFAPTPGKIIANPNCSTIQMLLVLAPIHAVANIKRVIVSTYQAVSGAGQALVDELVGAKNFSLLHPPPSNFSPLRPPSLCIADNVIPQIDVLQENGYSREEMKMLWESRKILNIPNLLLSATAVRVPVFNAHSEAVVIETEKPISVPEAIECLKTVPGLIVLSENQWITPKEVSGQDEVYVSRIRQDLAFGEYGLSFWIVADNLRKGAALNAVQIAEIFLKHRKN